MKNFLRYTYSWLLTTAAMLTGTQVWAQTAPVVNNTPTATLITPTTARLNGQVTSNGGAALNGRGFVISLTAVNNAPQLNGLGVTNASVTPFTVASYLSNRTGLLPASEYSFRSYASNSVGTTYSNVINFRTFATEPAAHVTGLTVGSITPGSIALSWTAPVNAPDGYIVLRRTSPGVSFTAAPVDGFVYSPGDVIGDATVVSVGANTNATATALANASQYRLQVYPYNGTGLFTNYRTAATVPGTSPFTLALEPATHSATFTTGARTNAAIALNFSAANTITNGRGYLILGRTGNVAPTGLPVDGRSYTVGTAIGDATVRAVITSNTATTANLTGLLANTQYAFTLVPYNVGANAATTNYFTDPVVPSVLTTTLLAAPTASATGLIFRNVTTTQTTVAFTRAAGNPSGHIILRRTTPGISFTALPVSGFSYNAGDVIGDATVVYAGTDTFATATGLLAGSAYNYRIYPYNGSGNNLSYRTATPLNGTRYTLSTEPTAHSDSFDVLSTGQTSLTFSFSAASTIPNAAGYLLIRRTGLLPPTTLPVDGVQYNAGAVLGNGIVAARITDVNAVQATITGLSPALNYTCILVPFNFSAASAQTHNYFTSPVVPQTTGFTLQAEPSTSSVLSFSNISPTGYDLSWTVANGATQYMLLRTTDTSGLVLPGTSPVDGVDYTVGGILGNATIVQISSSRTFSIAGMSPATAYGWRVFPFNGTSGRFNYRQTSPGSGTRYTVVATEPVAYPVNFVAGDVTENSIELAFSPASSIDSAKGYYILSRAGAAVASVPVDGIVYSVGSVIGTSRVAAIITNRADTATVITGLTDNTRYHFRIFPFDADTLASIQTRNARTTGLAPATSDSTVPAAPASQAINLSFTNITSAGMRLNWSAPVSPVPVPLGYVVLRTIAPGTVYPNTAPANGVEYTAGTTLGNATVVYSGTALFANVSSLVPDTRYSYSIYGYRNNGISRRYNAVNPLQGNAKTVVVAPTAVPSYISFTNDTTEITARYTYTGTAPAGFLLLRNNVAGNAIPALVPANGTGYTTGALIGNTRVVYAGPDSLAVAEALTPGGRYQFRLFVYNGQALDSSISYGASVASATYHALSRIPQRQPGFFTATGTGNTSITLDFPAASSLTNAQGYLILQKAGIGAFDSLPINRTIYQVGQSLGNGTIVAITDAAATSFEANSLAQDSIYNYILYPFNHNATESEETYHYRTLPTVLSDTGTTVSFVYLAEFRSVQPGNWQTNTTWEARVINGNGDTIWVPLPPSRLVNGENANVFVRHNVSLSGDVNVGNLSLDSGLVDIDVNAFTINGIVTTNLGRIDATGTGFITFKEPSGGGVPQVLPLAAFEQSTITNLVINNTQGVTLTGNGRLRLGEDLLLEQGVFNLTNDTLTLRKSAVTFGGQLNAAQAVLTFETAGSRTLPVGILVGNNLYALELNMGASDTLRLGGAVNLFATLQATGGSLQTNNNLTLKSSDTLTARIGTMPASTAITGNVTIEQYIEGGRRAFRFLAHPFTSSIALSQLIDNVDITGVGGAANGFTPSNTNNPSAFWYNPAIATGLANDPGWVAFTHTNGAGANAWPQGRGVRMLLRGAKGQGLSGNAYTPLPVTLTMSGPIQVGNYTHTLSLGPVSGFNLVSNPYPSSINMASLVRGDSIRPNFYVYDPYSGTAGAYLTFPYSFAYTLPAYASFYAVTNANFQNTIGFSESVKSGQPAGNLLRSANTEPREILTKVRLSGFNRNWDQIWMMKDRNGKDSLDFADAFKLNNDQVNLYTLSKENRLLSIDNRPFVSPDDTVRLGITSSFNGNFALNLDTVANLSAGQQLIFVDRFMGVNTVWQQGDSYPFSITDSAASKGNNRFMLIFRSGTTLASAAFTRFTGTRMADGANKLLWKYAHQNRPATHFELEASTNGQSFSTVAKLPFTNASHDYTYTHTRHGMVWYRVKAAGAGIYSPIVKLGGDDGNGWQLTVLPNPVKAGSPLMVQSNKATTVRSIRIVNTEGKTVHSSTNVAINAGVQTLPFVPALAPGVYLVLLSSHEGDLNVRLMVE